MLDAGQTSEAVVQRKEKGDKDAKVDASSEAVIYKIDVTANRYKASCSQRGISKTKACSGIKKNPANLR
jgi:hypothetical protein